MHAGVGASGCCVSASMEFGDGRCAATQLGYSLHACRAVTSQLACAGSWGTLQSLATVARCHLAGSVVVLAMHAMQHTSVCSELLVSSSPVACRIGHCATATEALASHHARSLPRLVECLLRQGLRMPSACSTVTFCQPIIISPFFKKKHLSGPA
ncbi:hypothetical protein COO60DRAFT_1542671 [Scenedesmus sp. NREL 46B-D3]|nr:hypothetical protein COO60DRAFT_1542671 [Scenedesmus sp. NREL 46B-D3]